MTHRVAALAFAALALGACRPADIPLPDPAPDNVLIPGHPAPTKPEAAAEAVSGMCIFAIYATDANLMAAAMEAVKPFPNEAIFVPALVPSDADITVTWGDVSDHWGWHDQQHPGRIVINSEVKSSSRPILEKAVAHEIGHALSLPDEPGTLGRMDPEKIGPGWSLLETARIIDDKLICALAS